MDKFCTNLKPLHTTHDHHLQKEMGHKKGQPSWRIHCICCRKVKRQISGLSNTVKHIALVSQMHQSVFSQLIENVYRKSVYLGLIMPCKYNGPTSYLLLIIQVLCYLKNCWYFGISVHSIRVILKCLYTKECGFHSSELLNYLSSDRPLCCQAVMKGSNFPEKSRTFSDADTSLEDFCTPKYIHVYHICYVYNVLTKHEVHC